MISTKHEIVIHKLSDAFIMTVKLDSVEENSYKFPFDPLDRKSFSESLFKLADILSKLCESSLDDHKTRTIRMRIGGLNENEEILFKKKPIEYHDEKFKFSCCFIKKREIEKEVYDNGL